MKLIVTYIVLLKLIEVVDQVAYCQVQVIVQVALFRSKIVYHFIRRRFEKVTQ